MTILQTIRGLFLIRGSIDLPLTHPSNKNFGFDAGSVIPKFNYSVDSLVDFCHDPRYFMDIKDDGSILEILFDGYNTEGEFDNVDQTQYPNLGLDNAFLILNLIYDMGLESIKPSSDPQLYRNKAEEIILTSTSLSILYVENSLLITKSNNVYGRISKVYFELDTSIGRRGFEIYLTPDDYMYKYGLDVTRYDVFHDWVNVPNTNTNIKNIIDESIFGFEKNNDYTNAMKFSTTRVVFSDDTDTDEVIRFQQNFFIYTHMYQSYDAPMYKKVQIVKRWLQLQPVYIGNYEKLKKHYPDLFSDSQIEIFPLTNNIQGDSIILPTSLASINDELDKRGVLSQVMEDGSNVEFFILEGLSKYDEDIKDNTRNSVFRVPMIAVSNIDHRPIGEKYPDFGIKYTGCQTSNSSWELLHFYIKMLSKLLLNITFDEFLYKNMDSEEISDSLGLSPNLGLEVEKLSIFNFIVIKNFKFTFNGVTYRIHGYDYGEVL